MLNSIAFLHRKQENFSLAEEYYLRSLDVLTHEVGLDHPLVATVLYNLGELCQTRGKLEEAEDYYTQSLAIWEQKRGQPLWLGQVLLGIAEVHRDRGEIAKMRQTLARALPLLKVSLGASHPKVLAIAETLKDEE